MAAAMPPPPPAEQVVCPELNHSPGCIWGTQETCPKEEKIQGHKAEPCHRTSHYVGPLLQSEASQPQGLGIWRFRAHPAEQSGRLQGNHKVGTKLVSRAS